MQLSKYEYRRRGGQEGISVTKFNMRVFVNMLEKLLNKEIEYGDMYIPLPEVKMSEQIKLLKENKCQHRNSEYWEDDKGAHGWCCSKCGTVVQWG